MIHKKLDSVEMTRAIPDWIIVTIVREFTEELKADWVLVRYNPTAGYVIRRKARA